LKKNLSLATKVLRIVIAVVVSVPVFYGLGYVLLFCASYSPAESAREWFPYESELAYLLGFLGFLIVVVIAIFYLYFLVRYIKKKSAEIKKLKAEELEKEAEKIRKENEKYLFGGLADLPAVTVALEYIHRCDVYNKDESNVNKRAAEIHLEALAQIIHSGKNLSIEDLGKIVQKISHIKHPLLDDGFFEIVSSQCLRQNAVELIFLGTNSYFGELPALFKYSAKKKEIVAAYLKSEGIQKTMLKLMYNEVKREFKTSIFNGLIGVLAYSYEKTWDEDILKDLLKKIQSLLDFADSHGEKLRHTTSREDLRLAIKTIVSDLLCRGLDIKIPLPK